MKQKPARAAGDRQDASRAKYIYRQLLKSLEGVGQERPMAGKRHGSKAAPGDVVMAGLAKQAIAAEDPGAEGTIRS